MKIKNKFGAILLLLVSLLVISCDEEILRDPSPEVSPDNNSVYFPEQDSSSTYRTLLLGISDPGFTVKIARKLYTQALTVKIKLDDSSAVNFSVPESVTFAAGESVTSFVVTVGNIEVLKSYAVNILVNDENLNPYYKFAITAWNIKKEDFAPYATGVYTDPFWNTVSSQDKVLEYSPSTKLYRMKGLFDGVGENLTFEWDGSTIIKIKDGSGPKLAAYIAKGYNTDYFMADNDSYVYAFFVNDQSRTVGGGKLSYDSTTKTFTFPIYWGLASGSGWGWKISTYQITSLF